MKRIAAILLGVLLVCVLASCGTRKGYRDDDPYLYKRGTWNYSKGGLVDDIPQFTLQMLESMFDYGSQPVDPPSEYETTTVVDSTTGGYAAAEAVGSTDAAISAGNAVIQSGAPMSVGGRIAAEAAAEAADTAVDAAQPAMTWK